VYLSTENTIDAHLVRGTISVAWNYRSSG